MVFGVIHKLLQTATGLVAEVVDPATAAEVHNRRHHFQHLPQHLQGHVHQGQTAVLIHDRHSNRHGH